MKVLLAVSGGIDSMTMADILFSHSRLCTLDCEQVGIAHCNFHLRPGDCDKDEALVRDWAAARGIPFYKTDFDTAEYAAEKGISIEMAARELRYGWFGRICLEHGYDAVATAHHADDNAETMMLNIVRGTGVRGLCGMTSEDFLPCQQEGVRIKLLRPMLNLTRAQIEQYAKEHNVPFRTDLSNLEDDYKRNRIRNRIIPVIKEMNPSFIRSTAAEMRHFRQANAILDIWMREHGGLVREDAEGGIRIGINALLATEGWDYFLWRTLEERGFSPDSAERLTRLLEDDGATISGKRFNAPGWSLLTTGSEIILTRTHADADAQSLDSISGDSISGICDQVGDSRIIASENGYDGHSPLDFEEGSLLLDADKLGEWEVRNWQDGDWFIPFGMKGRKKVSDWFTDRKASLDEKKEAIVVATENASDGRIAAVMCARGCRQDDSLKVDANTRRILKLKFVGTQRR